MKLTDETETNLICSAIYHHDDKLTADGPMDEVLKDAGVIGKLLLATGHDYRVVYLMNED